MEALCRATPHGSAVRRKKAQEELPRELRERRGDVRWGFRRASVFWEAAQQRACVSRASRLRPLCAPLGGGSGQLPQDGQGL